MWKVKTSCKRIYKIIIPMKKPLLNLFSRLWTAETKILVTPIAFILFLFVHLTSTAQSVTRAECFCLSNQTSPGNGQFADTIIITGPTGANWTVVSAYNFYSGTSPAPPAVPVAIAPGTVIPEGPVGKYRLPGRRLDGTNWSVSVTNGTVVIPVTNQRVCRYPNLRLFGDIGSCLGGLDAYRVDIPTANLVNPLWTVTNGILIGTNTNNNIQVQWPSVVGVGHVAFDALARSYPGQSQGLCTVDLDQDVVIADEANAVIACNNVLNISLGSICELTIDPYMVLEDPEYPITSYDIVLKDIQADTIIPFGRVNQAYLKKTLQVSVIHECSGNSCWGLIKLDDKSIPPLVCGPNVTINCNQLTGPAVTGFPLPPTASYTLLPNGKYLVKDFDLCSDVTLYYQDEIAVGFCDGPFSSIIERTWIATDITGNTTTCSNFIYINKADISVITFPPTYDSVLGPNPSLYSCGTFPRLPDGNPDPIFTGSPAGVFCLNVEVRFTDLKILACRGDKSFKIIRKWTVTDLCNPQTQITHNQTITVMDNVAPSIAPPPDFTVGTQGLTCAAPINVPPPIILFECSNYQYYVSYKVPDNLGLPSANASTDGVVKNQNGTYTINPVPPGVTKLWIVYKVVDDCDNTSEVMTMVNIIDSTPPVPVCKEYTYVGLNAEGVAWAGVDAFEDGSWDNCALDKLRVRRMETSSCGVTNVFGDKIKFCCDDIGKEIMIQLEAVDKAGNTNQCMVRVSVQDNIPPTITFCPANVTVGCDANLFTLGIYGTVTFTDICGATLTEEKLENYNSCGIGLLTRIFKVTDKSGNVSSCQQLITVKSLNPFIASDITWPADHTVLNGCMDSGTEPGDLPVGKREPVLKVKPCTQTTFNHEDIVFQYVDGACFKILRKWTVLDWCQFNPFLPNVGKWEHTQVIKVMNNIAPTITKGCNDSDITMTSVDNCKSNVLITADATDDCSRPENLDWEYSVDLLNNGTVDITGIGRTFNRVMDFGTHKITWTVTDECGNSKTCSKVFTVRDTKSPTPYCLSEIVTVLMETDGTAVIWASDFDKGSYDNCSNISTLKFSFSPNLSNTSRTFTCDSLITATTTFDLRIYVTDDSGNFDYCTVSIKIQDNNDFCNLNNVGNGSNTKVALSGSVKSESNVAIKNVQVKLSADLPEFPLIQPVTESGSFAFENIVTKNNYDLSANKDQDYLEGVSTLDLVLIQRHILGVKKLDNPYRVIASDVNNDKKVTSGDLVAIRKLILGTTAKFEKSPSWKFIDSKQTFADANAPFPVAETITLTNVTEDAGDNKFIGVKMGDVNATATNLLGNEADGRSNYVFNYSVANPTNDKVIVKLNSRDIAEMEGFQMALTYDPTSLAFEGVESNGIVIDESNLGLSEIGTGKLLISWNKTQGKITREDLFKLVFRKIGSSHDGKLLSMDPFVMNPEIYVNSGNEVISYSLGLRSEAGEKSEFELFQNTPNPFNDATVIGFNLPEASEASLKVFDIQGRKVLEKNGTFQKGYNKFELIAKELGVNGILYYQVETGNYSSKKIMIVIN